MPTNFLLTFVEGVGRRSVQTVREVGYLAALLAEALYLSLIHI